MAYIPLRTEKSVTELVNKVYSNLADKDRIKAEAAMIKENPALKNFANLKRGTLIRIPEIKNVKRKKTRSVSDPDGELMEDYLERLEVFSETLAKNNDIKDDEQKETQSILKKSAINKLLNEDAEAKKIASDLKKHISEDTKKRKETESQSKKAFSQLKKDLEKFLK